MAKNTSGLLKGGPPRQKGVPNKATVEVKQIAAGMLKDERYRDQLMARLRRGTAGAMEVTLWHYAHGKPRETVGLEHSGALVVRWLDDDDPDE